MVVTPLKGFIIYNSANGNHCYHRYFNDKGVLSKEPGFRNITFDQADPHKIAAIFFSMSQIANVIVEEYKEEYPDDNDPNTKLAFQQGFQGMKSDSIDYMLEQHEQYPLTLALFYDSNELDDDIARYLSQRLLDIYALKKEKILKKGGNLQGLSRSSQSTQAFEAALPLILENVSKHFCKVTGKNFQAIDFFIDYIDKPIFIYVQVLIEFVKSAFIDFSAESLMVPWIYICYNNEFSAEHGSEAGGQSGSGAGANSAAGQSADASATADKSKKASQSFNSSKAGAGGLGTSTNINKSNVGLLNANNADQYNSGINDSDLDIEKEYGYATDEDSVFVEFPQKDEEKVISRLSKKVGHNTDIAATKR